MPEFFFRLDEEERREVIQQASLQSGMPEDVLEKDVWLVWTLHQIFAVPGVPYMAFKGGTALSKVFGAIERFSEDVDVSVDYKQLAPDLTDVDLSSMTRNARKQASDRLRKLLAELSHDVLAPHLSTAAQALVGGGCKVEVAQSGEQLRLHYPAAAAKGGYLKDEILIELGGRNPTEPNQDRRLETEIARILPQFSWPTADVSVLDPTRTFWEKATLIHIECNRPDMRIQGRMFRHWYDLSKLMDHRIGAEALADLPLLERVVRHKEAFFAYANLGYDGCLAGRFKLVPPDGLLGVLRADCQGMVEQRMFFGTQPHFDEVMVKISDLEAAINGRTRHG